MEDIWNEAEDDFTDIEKVLNQDTLSRADFNVAKKKLDMWIKAAKCHFEQTSS